MVYFLTVQPPNVQAVALTDIVARARKRHIGQTADGKSGDLLEDAKSEINRIVYRNSRHCNVRCPKLGGI